MVLEWILNSAFTQVLGLTERQSNQKYAQEGIKNVDREGIKNVDHVKPREEKEEDCFYGFRMPLHYPRYTKEDYHKMEEGKLDLLLKQYGLCFDGTVDEKRAFVISTFWWPDQL